MREIHPERAIVRPPVQSELSGERLLLEDVVEPFVRRGRPGAICVSGPTGSGKSTSLAHLAAVLARGSIVAILDDPQVSDVTELSDRMLVLYSSAEPFPVSHVATCRLANWGEDEALEYAMAVHEDRCAFIMNRLRTAMSSSPVPDTPELWRICLDEMAADMPTAEFGKALERHLTRRVRGRMRRRVAEFCLDKLLSSAPMQVEELRLWGHSGCLGFILGRGLGSDELRLLRCRRVQVLLASEKLARDFRSGAATPYLERALPRDLVAGTGHAITDDPWARRDLVDRLADNPALQPMVASILHAAGSDWRPSGKSLNLKGAFLAGAIWPKLVLRSIDLAKADLTSADLSESTIQHAWLRETRLRGANLTGSIFETLAAPEAIFTDADLTEVGAEGANFLGADFTGARLESARLRKASFNGANLQGARFNRADLRGAVFQTKWDHESPHTGTEAGTKELLRRAQSVAEMKWQGLLPKSEWFRYLKKLIEGCARRLDVTDADFSGADLDKAHLAGLDLRKTILAGARFQEADLHGSNLEGVRCAGGVFERANLQSAILTASSMPEANFRGAWLNLARLGEIEWERADLREADLRKAAFHMGSSRSGLVFGEPSEGTRNGFYTDEYYDQSYRRPEEIRVANLTGADLRGALLEGADFYLVDLRGARYTPEQEVHLRKCGAILETRV